MNIKTHIRTACTAIMNHVHSVQQASHDTLHDSTPPVTHDYSQRYWGHDYTFTPLSNGTQGSATGWGLNIKQGDFILLQQESGSSRYRVEHIEYYADPSDMWKAQLLFAPRMHPVVTA